VATALALGPGSSRADTSTTATATVASPTQITISWPAPSATVTVTKWIVLASRSADGAIAGMQTVCGTCTSATFDYLSPGTTYRFAVAGLGAPSGTIWASRTATTATDPICAGVTQPCTAVDATRSIAPTTGVGLGLLRGLTTRTSAASVAPLSLNYHRIGAWEPERFATARQAGGQIDIVLSDAWPRYAQATYGRQLNPWEDWDGYRRFIVGIVQWHRAHGLVPDYWEIQNEPDLAIWYPTPTVGQGPTEARVLQQFAVAHDTIRSVLPDAKIVGPSVGNFDPIPGAVISLGSFLDFAARNGLRFDVIAWHEVGGDCGGRCDGGPRGIAQHLTTVRSLLAQHPALGEPELHINEFGDPRTVGDAGYAVGYFAAMAATGVTKGSSACWPVRYDLRTYDGCFYDPGTLDSLLTPDGASPTASWWVWRSYAQMTGQRVVSSVSQPDMSVHATKATDGSVSVLLGRHEAGLKDPVATAVRIAVGNGRGQARVTITSIPATLIGAVTPTTSVRDVAVTKGVIDLGSLTIPDGAAVAITIAG
jgi:hypothetical protein